MRISPDFPTRPKLQALRAITMALLGVSFLLGCSSGQSESASPLPPSAEEPEEQEEEVAAAEVQATPEVAPTEEEVTESSDSYPYLEGLNENDPSGALLTFDECWKEGETWRFRGHVDLPAGVPIAQFGITVGWVEFTDMPVGPNVWERIEVEDGAAFEIAFRNEDTRQTPQARASVTGTIGDEICWLKVERGTTPVVERDHLLGPTTEGVSGPRLVEHTRLLAGPGDPEPRPVDVVGWLTHVSPSDGEELDIDGGLTTWGTSATVVDSLPVEVPATTPVFVGCQLISSVLLPDGIWSAQADPASCLLVAGRDDEGAINWVVLLRQPRGPNGQRVLDTSLDASAPGPKADLYVYDFDSEFVYSRGPLPFRLPIARSTVPDCDHLLGPPTNFSGLWRTIATLNTDSGEIIAIRCEWVF